MNVHNTGDSRGYHHDDLVPDVVASETCAKPPTPSPSMFSVLVLAFVAPSVVGESLTSATFNGTVGECRTSSSP